MKLTDRASKHISLVYFGKTYVYVKDVNSLFFLRNSFLENVVHISLAQSLLEALFTRGIYALSDKHGALTEDHGVSVGRNEGVALFFYGYGRDICAALSKKRNMLGCRAAASACYQHAFLNERAYFCRKFLRCYIIYRLTVFGFGKSGVWLENYGNRGVFKIFLYYGCERLGTERAVDTDSVSAHTLKHRDHSSRCCACHKLSVLTVGVGDEHGQIAVLLRGEKSRFSFVAIVHSLDKHEIGAVFCTETNCFCEYLYRVLKIKVSVGLEKLTERTYIKRYPFGFLTCLRLFRVFYCRFYYIFKLTLRELERVCTEGVGVYDVAACLIVAAVNVGYYLGVRKIPSLRKLACLKSLRL